MIVGVAQMNSISGDIPRNVVCAIGLIHEAAKQGSDIVLLPEFFNMEYFAQYRDLRYLEYAEPLDGYTIQQVAAAAKQNRVWVVANIFEKQRSGFLYDTAVLIDRDGNVHGAYRKAHPAAVYGLEKIYIRYGSHFPVFDIEGWRVGMMICWDTYFPEVARTLALHGAELILVPFAAPKPHLWQELLSIRAFENGLFIAACNKVGPEGEWDFYGQSLVVNPAGEVIARVQENATEVFVAELDRSLVAEWRKRYPMFRDRRPDLYGSLVTSTEDL